MSDYPGKHLKVCASVILWLGLIGAFIGWFALLLSEHIALSFVELIAGGFTSLIISSVLSGFGTLIEDVQEIKKSIVNGQYNSSVSTSEHRQLTPEESNIINNYINELRRQLNNNEISPEEYNAKIDKIRLHYHI